MTVLAGLTSVRPQVRIQDDGLGGLTPPPSKKSIILYWGFLLNWLHTEGQTVPNILYIAGESPALQ